MLVPKVSVIIPFYNRFDKLSEALESVFSQTFRDFEIILVDDGSTGDIRRHVDISNPKIHYLKQKNKGPASARNMGIKYAKGKYLAFLDSDDLFLPSKLEKQVELMDQNPKVILSHTSYIIFDNKTKKDIEVVNSGTFTGRVFPWIMSNCSIATPTVMLRKENLHNLLFDESKKIGEDIIFWSEIAKNSKILGIQLPLSKVRRNENSASVNIKAQIEGFTNILDYTKKYRDPANILVSLDISLKLSYLKHSYLRKLYLKKKLAWQSFKQTFLVLFYIIVNPFEYTHLILGLISKLHWQKFFRKYIRFLLLSFFVVWVIFCLYIWLILNAHEGISHIAQISNKIQVFIQANISRIWPYVYRPDKFNYPK